MLKEPEDFRRAALSIKEEDLMLCKGLWASTRNEVREYIKKVREAIGMQQDDNSAGRDTRVNMRGENSKSNIAPGPGVSDLFTHWPPMDADQVRSHEHIRKMGLVFASMVDDLLPSSREKTESISRIREAVMWANAGLALHVNRLSREGNDGND